MLGGPDALPDRGEHRRRRPLGARTKTGGGVGTVDYTEDLTQ